MPRQVASKNIFAVIIVLCVGLFLFEFTYIDYPKKF